ncbi:unnamed protein product [Sphenostylis stenocarpa]|uniref:Uncharacterized protein n=1 Tax=Sphenostylis stenocarpa TaxID=92480 RepID=A0AA86SN36_9FABA|nr:unnamed protein product [Sphenostylis stenocarpa]
MAADCGTQQQWFVSHSTILVRQKGSTELQFSPVTMLFFFKRVEGKTLSLE